MHASLRFRMMAAAAATIMLALIITGAGINWFFARHIEQREAEALIRDAKLIVGNLRLDAAGKPTLDEEPGDDRYHRPASGLYWQLDAVGGGAQSQSLWDQNLPPPPTDQDRQWRARHGPGPFGNRLLTVSRSVITQGTQVRVQVAGNDAPASAARREFMRETILSLGLLGLLLLVAAHIQTSLGLRPLARVRRQLIALRQNPAARLPITHPREIGPLISAINALAGARETDLARARKRAGDLAHSLKTPLAALAAQARRAGTAEAASGLEQAIAAIRAALETELARSRAAAIRESGQSRPADIEMVVENLVAVVERTEAGERVVFEVALAPDLHLPVAVEDLTELLGALIENAVRHARNRIRISGSMARDAMRLSIEDDGPGMIEEVAAIAMTRGRRLDEAEPGHGLGLSIVQDFLDATGGSIALARSGLGGLAAHLAWPIESDAAAG